MVERATERVIKVTPQSTFDGVLDQLRESPPGPVVVALDPLSTLFSTPDHFRALDGARLARSLAVTIAVDDPHRTGLALAFGYRVRPLFASPGDSGLSSPPVAAGRQAGKSAITTGGFAASRNGTHALEAPAEWSVDTSPDGPLWDEANNRASRSRRSPSARLWKIGLIELLAIIVVASGLGGMALIGKVHRAEVSITPAEQSFSRVVPFAVSVVPTDDPNAIQTTVFTKTLTREGDALATGKATVPDGTAAGAMTFRSRADGATTIKAGTALKGPRDVSYTLLTDVVVPGLDFGRGQLGEATARVRATQPGPAGNLGAGFSVRYTENMTYISGDITGGTEKQLSVVTDDDIAAVRGRLESDLRLHALTEVNAQLPAGVTALNDYLTLQTPVTTAQPAAGTQADSAHVRVALSAQLPVYRNTDFDALIDRRLTEAVHEAGGGGERALQVLPATVAKSKPVFVDVQGPLVRYFATVTGKTRSVITDADLQQMGTRLAGKDDASARRFLADDATIQEVRIVYGPSWLPSPLRSRMPRDPAHIRVNVGS